MGREGGGRECEGGWERGREGGNVSVSEGV